MDGVYFPKQVYIANPLLCRCYWLTMILAVSGQVWYFIAFNMYRIQVPMDDYIHVSMWVPDDGDMRMQDEWIKQSAASVCTSPQDLEYWYDSTDSDSVWKYESFQCLRPCFNHLDTGSLCLPRRSSYIRESQASTLLVSSFARTEHHLDGSSTTDFYLVPTVTALKLKIAFSFAVPEKNPFLESYRLDHKNDIVEGSSREDVVTIVMDKDRNVNSTFKTFPNSGIELPLPLLMQLAGQPDLLGSVQNGLGRNHNPNAKYQDGPTAWVSGSKLSLIVECYRSQQHGDSSIEGNVCYIIVENIRTWAYFDDRFNDGAGLEIQGKSAVDYVYQGVRVTAVTGGFWDFTDWTRVYLNVVAAVVFLSYVKVIVLFFVSYFLGQLSEVYNRVLYENYNIAQEIGTMVTQMVISSRAFWAWEEDVGSEILKADLLNAMKDIEASLDDHTMRPELGLENVAMERDDLRTVVDIAFGAIIAPKWVEHYDNTARFYRACNQAFKCVTSCSIKRLWSNKHELPQTVQQTNRRMSLAPFLESYSQAQSASLLDYMKLLSVNRRNRSWLEQKFTPEILEVTRSAQYEANPETSRRE